MMSHVPSMAGFMLIFAKQEILAAHWKHFFDHNKYWMSWLGGLDHRIQVLVVTSSECGFESRSWHFFEQDILLYLLFFTHYWYKWVPARVDMVEVDIVYEKAFGALRLPRAVYSPGSWERWREYYWPNDQGTTVKSIEMVKLWNAL